MATRLTFLTVTVGIALVFQALASAQAPATKLDPPGPPGPTMKTLDEIPPTWSRILPAAKRFQLVMDGAAVLDQETGVVWEQSPSTSVFNWLNAQNHCNKLRLGNRLGWRLPTIQEVASLLDLASSDHMPSGHPFTSVPSGAWSGTLDASFPDAAWHLLVFPFASVGHTLKENPSGAWCVRGARGGDLQ